MFYGVYELYGKIHSEFYYIFDDWYSDTWCPDTQVKLIIDMKAHGKTYDERKNCIREKAIDFQNLFSVYGISLSYRELLIFDNFFTTYGKRYGLLREFHENGIC